MTDQPPYPPPGPSPDDAEPRRPLPGSPGRPPEPPTQPAWGQQQSPYDQGPYGQQPAQTPYGQTPYGQVPHGGTPYQPYQPYQAPGFGYHFRQNHSGATTSMTLGIISIVASVLGACLCGFLGAAGALIGPFGIWQATRARADIRADPERYSNEGHATTGLVCSIIGTVLGVLLLVFTIVMMVIYGIALFETGTY